MERIRFKPSPAYVKLSTQPVDKSVDELREVHSSCGPASEFCILVTK